MRCERTLNTPKIHFGKGRKILNTEPAYTRTHTERHTNTAPVANGERDWETCQKTHSNHKPKYKTTHNFHRWLQ